MERNHLSLIFYFLINIVIFTSVSSENDLFGQPEGDEMKITVENAFQSGMTFDEIVASLVSHHEVPNEAELTRNADDIFNHVTRDVGGKAAAAASKSTTSTSNGKLIYVLFIGVARCFTPVHAEIPFHFPSPLHVHLPNRQFIVLF